MKLYTESGKEVNLDLELIENVLEETLVQEGIISKIKGKWKKYWDEYKKQQEELRKKYSKEKKKNEKVTYSNSDYQYCHRQIEEWVDRYNNKKIFDFDGYPDICALDLYYLGITKSQFISIANKLESKCKFDSGDLAQYLTEGGYENDEEAIELEKYLKTHKYIIYGDDNSGDYLLWFFKEKKFGYWGHECDAGNGFQFDIDAMTTYEETMKEAKSFFEDERYRYALAYKAADANLGYYRLSDPPEGVKPRKFNEK